MSLLICLSRSYCLFSTSPPPSLRCVHLTNLFRHVPSSSLPFNYLGCVLAVTSENLASTWPSISSLLTRAIYRHHLLTSCFATDIPLLSPVLDLRHVWFPSDLPFRFVAQVVFRFASLSEVKLPRLSAGVCSTFLFMNCVMRPPWTGDSPSPEFSPVRDSARPCYPTLAPPTPIWHVSLRGVPLL